MEEKNLIRLKRLEEIAQKEFVLLKMIHNLIHCAYFRAAAFISTHDLISTCINKRVKVAKHKNIPARLLMNLILKINLP